MIFRIICVSCFLIFLVSNSFGQFNDLKYIKNIDISSGLAHNGVTSILEDSRGYLWFGTFDGLNRYDGYSVNVFKNTPDKHIIRNNRVRSLIEDQSGNIWIGTEDGISIFNIEKEKFFDLDICLNMPKINGGSNLIIKKILPIQNLGFTVSITRRNGIIIVDNKFRLIDQVDVGDPENKNFILNDCFLISKSEILITSNDGLFLFNLKSKEVNRVLSQDIKFCHSITFLNENQILVSTNNGAAISSFSRQNDNLIFKDPEFVLKDFQIRTSLLDANGSLWLGLLNNGLLKIENPFMNGKIADPQENLGQLLRMNNLRSSVLYETSFNQIWLGTYNKGLFNFSNRDNPFKSLDLSNQIKISSALDYVNHIIPYDSSRVFLTLPVGRLLLFNTYTKNIEKLPFFLSEYSNSASSLYIDKQKNFWLRTYNSNSIMFKGNDMKTFLEIGLPNSNALPENLKLIRSFVEDGNGDLWIGTTTNIYKIEKKIRNKLSVVDIGKQIEFDISEIRLLYADPRENYIWVCTDSDGLYRINYGDSINGLQYQTDHYSKNNKTPNALNSNFVSSIIRLPNNDLWIGTEGGGVSKILDAGTHLEFKSTYSEKNGLSNNAVKSILYDDDSNLWVSTNNGLNKINLTEKNVQKYHKSDGLIFNDFWFESEKANDSLFIFTGFDGLIYFNPKNFNFSEELPKIRLQNFKIFNNGSDDRELDNQKILMSENPSGKNELHLEFDQNVFSFDMISLHFSNTANHNIKYRLLPLNEEWMVTPSFKNTISYSGLQPGNYVFEYSASNSTNEYGIPRQFNITISPPFYKTIWAYSIYFLLGILTIFLIRKNALKMQKLEYDVQIEQIERDNIKKSNEEKLRFFSNISHEIKTPLTLIMGPTKNLINRYGKNPNIGSDLSIIDRQAKKIFQLIDQVQDYTRFDLASLNMNYTRFIFNEFMKSLAIDFFVYGQTENKKFYIEHSLEPITVSADMDKLEKILNNVIINAFKYTDSGDQINVSYRTEDKDLIIEVEDSGRGIDEIDLAHIFERFYQSHKQKNVHLSGSGIGLAFSKRLVEMHYGFITAESNLDIGTKIKVRLPIVKKFSNDDLMKFNSTEITKLENKKVNEEYFLDTIIDDNFQIANEFKDSLIFYVEDNQEMRVYVTKFLSKFFKVDSFNNGIDCLEALQSHWPDLILSDIQMPKMSGLELCLKIKSDLKTSHIPVVLLTGLTNIEHEVKGLKDGADSYIKKPFDSKHLLITIESLLANRKQLRERYQIGIPLSKDNKNNRNDNAFLDKLYSLIEENLDNQNFDLDNLAKELYLNRTHFYQKVKTLTNHTPLEILRNYRLKKAAFYLSQEKLPVNEVYNLVGFKSRTHFSKVFKEKYGVSAGSYGKRER